MKNVKQDLENYIQALNDKIYKAQNETNKISTVISLEWLLYRDVEKSKKHKKKIKLNIKKLGFENRKIKDLIKRTKLILEDVIHQKEKL